VTVLASLVPPSFRIVRDPIRIIETAGFDYGDARFVEVPMVKVLISTNEPWPVLALLACERASGGLHCRLAPASKKNRLPKFGRR
jgi:hypothetical protein